MWMPYEMQIKMIKCRFCGEKFAKHKFILILDSNNDGDESIHFSIKSLEEKKRIMLYYNIIKWNKSRYISFCQLTQCFYLHA